MFVTVYVPNVRRGNSEQISAQHKELHYMLKFDLIHCVSSLQIIEVYDGLIDGH